MRKCDLLGIRICEQKNTTPVNKDKYICITPKKKKKKYDASK